MALIPYLTGGETATAAGMNLLAAELDRKLTVLLGGRTFLLASGSDEDTHIAPRTVPKSLCGKFFFFTAGRSNYSRACPGYVEAGSFEAGFAATPYDHGFFAAAEAGVTVLEYDEANKVAVIDAIDPADYGGREYSAYSSLFDHSLAAHYVLYQGADDTSPVPYYLREKRDALVGEPMMTGPERRWKYALAELVLEGVGTVSIPHTWDKYNCFRIHNLNKSSATVEFKDENDDLLYSVSIGAYGIATVRRDSVSENYRAGYNYLFAYEAGDGRFYSNPPHAFDFQPQAPYPCYVSGTADPHPSSAHSGNNLTNAVVMLEWLWYFRENREVTPETLGARNGPFWIRDPSVQDDLNSEWDSVFLAPDDQTAKVGDLFAHKGNIIIAKVHRTETELGFPRVEFDSVTFNGFATMVADFAAKGLIVAPDGNGRLTVTASDLDWEYDLIPTGTNLFVAHGQNARLSAMRDIESAPVILRSEIFENTAGTVEASDIDYQVSGKASITNTETSPALVAQTALTAYGGGESRLSSSGTVTSTDQYRMTRVSGSTRPQFLRLDTGGASSLASLRNYGDATLGSQSDANVVYSSETLRRTGSGLVLTFNEAISMAHPPGGLQQGRMWYWDIDEFRRLGYGLPTVSGGALVYPRAIKFRGHGFGWPDAGAELPGFSGGAKPHAFATQWFKDAIVAASGEGFNERAVRWTPGQFSMLWHLGAAGFLFGNTGFSNVGDPFHPCTDATIYNLDRFMREINGNGPVYSAARETWVLPGPPAAATFTDLRLPLYAAHYNTIAREINAHSVGRPISWEDIIWDWSGGDTAAQHYFRLEPPGANVIFQGVGSISIPVPREFFMEAPSGWLQSALSEYGVAILGEEDLPDYEANKDRWPEIVPLTFRFHLSPSSVIAIGQSPAPGGFPATLFEFNIDASFTKSEGTPIDYDPDMEYAHQVLTERALFPDDVRRNPSEVYAGFKWVSVSSIGAMVQSIGLPLLLDDFFVPVGLDFVRYPTRLIPGPLMVSSGTTGRTGLLTFGRTPADPIPIDQLRADGTEIQPGYFPLLAGEVRFFKTPDPSKCTWKYYGVGSPGFGINQPVARYTANAAIGPQKNLRLKFPVTVVPFGQYDPDNGSIYWEGADLVPASTFPAVFPELDVLRTDYALASSSNQEDEGARIEMDKHGHFVALLCRRPAGMNTGQTMILYNRSFWSVEADYWKDEEGTYVFGFGEYDPENGLDTIGLPHPGWHLDFPALGDNTYPGNAQWVNYSGASATAIQPNTLTVFSGPLSVPGGTAIFQMLHRPGVPLTTL